MIGVLVACRAWRQKIEAWLQENEKEEKQSEDLRRRSRRVQSNRRSLEADSGGFFVTRSQTGFLSARYFINAINYTLFTCFLI